jgi:Tfp pilus assembly protein PilF
MHPDAEALLSAYAEGRLEEAAGLAQSMTERLPNFGLGWMVLGAVLMQAGKNAEALMPLQKGAALSPDNADAHNNLGVAFLNLGRLDEARQSLERALQIDQDYAQVHNNLGNLFRRLHMPNDAERCYRKALEISLDYAQAHNNLGVLLRDEGRLLDAKESAVRAISLAPEDADAHNNLGAILLDMGLFDQAEQSCRRALQLQPDHVRAHNNLASVLKEMMRPDEAEQNYKLALSISPDDTDALHGLANLHLERGEVREAHCMYARILEDHSGNIEVRYNLALSQKTREGDENFAALAGLAPLSRKDQIFQHYALGKCIDDRADYQKAFLHYSEGARLKRAILDYDPDRADERFATVAQDFGREAMARLKGAGHPSELPVFVLGMPRSGTTLIEQIIASHPDVQAGGELVDFLRIVERGESEHLPLHQKIAEWGKEYIRTLQARAPHANRITDKMPANFFAIGLIHAMLPNARILHVRRNPLDTCLSCYTQLFNRAHEYSYDLAELGRYYAGYAGLMGHWRKVLPEGSFLEVDYEEVVSDPEGQARRMIEYCGLEWSDACLDFYRNARPVQTASVMQVRQPVYRSSVGRWKHYEPCLAPLIDALGELAPG